MLPPSRRGVKNNDFLLVAEHLKEKRDTLKATYLQVGKMNPW
jgi:hypothetical protein